MWSYKYNFIVPLWMWPKIFFRGIALEYSSLNMMDFQNCMFLAHQLTIWTVYRILMYLRIICPEFSGVATFLYWDMIIFVYISTDIGLALAIPFCTTCGLRIVMEVNGSVMLEESCWCINTNFYSFRTAVNSYHNKKNILLLDKLLYLIKLNNSLYCIKGILVSYNMLYKRYLEVPGCAQISLP